MGADINAKDSYGMTALLYAIQWCDLDMVKLLAERGAQTNAVSKDGTTAIADSVINCSDKPEKASVIIDILLEKGCNLDDPGKNGHTPYWHAMEYRYMNMVGMLRKRGVMEKFRYDNTSGFDEGLRVPSWYTPPAGTYVIPSDQEERYKLAVEDCNHMVVGYKKGLLFATGPIGYGVGLLVDQVRVPGNFQKCMEVMGFNCSNSCAK
jgi:ankyrin repeat protein